MPTFEQTYVCPRCFESHFEDFAGHLKCKLCGYERPAAVQDDEKILLEVATRDLRLSNFLDAEEAFLDAAKKCGDSSLAYWGAFLSRYGVRYEQDIDGTMIPTCNSLSHICVYDNDHYKKAISLASPEEKKTYEEEAKRIEEIRREWYEKAQHEKPYDVFLCFKQSDDNTKQRTEDYNKAYDIYNLLGKWGYRVFFAPVSLPPGKKYEPYIYSALKSAKALLVFSSKVAYVNATWVKNEWYRYAKMIGSGEKKPDSLVVIYDGFDPATLPSQLSSVEHIDRQDAEFAPKLGSYIVATIGQPSSASKKMDTRDPETLDVVEIVQKHINPVAIGGSHAKLNVDEQFQLEAGYEFLASENYKSAAKRFDQVLSTNPESAEAKLGVFLATMEAKDLPFWISLFKVKSILDLLPIIVALPTKKASEALGQIVEEAKKHFPDEDSLRIYEAVANYKDDSANAFTEFVYQSLSSGGDYLDSKAFLNEDPTKIRAYFDAAAPYLGNKKACRCALNIGKAYLGQNLFDKAQPYFDLYLSFGGTPKEGKLLRTLAICKVKKAEDIFKFHHEDGQFAYVEDYLAELEEGELVALLESLISNIVHYEHAVQKDYEDVDKLLSFYPEGQGKARISPLLLAADSCLEKRWFDLAGKYYRFACSEDPELAKAWWGLLLASNSCGNDDELANIEKEIDEFEEYDQALMAAKGDRELRARIVEAPKRQRALKEKKLREMRENAQKEIGVRRKKVLCRRQQRIDLAKLDREGHYPMGLTSILDGMEDEATKALAVFDSLPPLDNPEHIEQALAKAKAADDACDHACEAMILRYVRKKEEINGKRRRRPFIIGGSILGITAIVLGVYFGVIKPNIDKAAMISTDATSWQKMIADGDYEKAIAEMESCSYQEDRPYLEKYKAYAQAGKSFESGDYESGIADIVEQGGVVEIEYDANGGSMQRHSQTIGKGLYIDNIAHKDGYSFDGWAVSSASLNVDKNTADLSLLAGYSLGQYDIRYVLYGGSNSNSNPLSYTFGDTFELEDPSKRGYEFAGWYKDEDLNKPFDGIKSTDFGDITIYSAWTPVQYDIEYRMGSGAVNAPNNPETYTIEDESFQLLDPSRPGYTFTGWVDSDGKAVASIDTSRCEKISLVATWSVNVYSISYDLGGGTNNAQNPSSYTIEDNDIQLQDPTKDGYSFDGWTTSEGAIESIDPNTCENIALTANWSLQQYTITYDLDGGVNSASNPSSYTVEDSDITLAAPEKAGYTFQGWTKAGESITQIDTSACEAMTLTANWSLNTYSIDYVLDGGVNSASNPTSYTVLEADKNLADPTCAGREFAGWYMNSDFSGDPVTYIDTETCENITLYAYWDPLTIDYYRLYDNGNGTVKILSYFGTDGVVSVPSELGGKAVVEIASGAFSANSGLSSVTLPDGVTAIGDNAFANCTNLVLVSMPSSVTSIGNRAFLGCAKMNSLTLPEHLESLGERCFAGCVLLPSSPSIPQSVSSFGDYCFLSCTSLYTINIQNADAVLGKGMFKNCTRLEHLSLPCVGGKETGQGYLGYLFDVAQADVAQQVNYVPKSLQTVAIEGNQQSIEPNAFYGLSNIAAVNIDSPIVEIGDNAFNGCAKLANFYLQEFSVVTTIGSHAFDNCRALTSFPFSTSLSSISDYAFYNCIALASIDLPEGLLSIGDYAFSRCNQLTSVTIPSSVASLGDGAFSSCSHLQGVSILGSLDRIGAYAFSSCSNLSSVTLPSTLSYIDETAFSNDSALTYTEYDGAKYLGNSQNPYLYLVKALSKAIASFDVPASTKIIGSYAFSDCTSLTSVSLPDGLKQISSYAFSGCTALPSLDLPSNLSTIGEGAFYRTRITSLELSSGLERYGRIALPDTLENLTYRGSLESWLAMDKQCSIFGSQTHLYLDGASEEATSIAIPASITSLGDYSFAHCLSLTSIDLGNSLTSIGKGAFIKCTGLEEIALPSSLSEIGDEAFEYCSSLKGVSIPEGVTQINNRLFDNCSNLLSVSLPAQLESIGPSAFYECEKLASLDIPSSVTQIGDSAFGYCRALDSVTLSDGIASIPLFCFFRSGISSITLPANLTTIGSCAFEDCSSLGAVALPDSLQTISSYAFSGCTSLQQIAVPESVTSIGSYCFKGCSALATASLPSTVTSIPAHIFENCTSLGSFSIKASVTSIGEYAFAGCTNLKFASFSNNVSNLESIGDFAFYNCSSLITMTLPETLSSIGVSAFNGCSSLTEITVPSGVTSLTESCFANCSALASVSLPETLQSIGTKAFQNDISLASIVLPSSVNEFGERAFGGCANLQSVDLPSSVTSLPYYLFENCSSLVSVAYRGTLSSWLELSGKSRVDVPFHLYLNGDSSETKSIVLPDGTTKIGENAFYRCENLQSVSIPESVTSISGQAFAYCTSLSSVALPSNLTYLGASAFYSCTSLTSISIPSSVTTFGNGAFADCIRLTSVTLPNNMVTLPAGYFRNCYSLRSIALPSTITKIEDSAFENCRGLTSITLPSGLTYLGIGAFYFCSEIRTIVIPDGITSIAYRTFQGCGSLCSLTLPDGLTKIGSSAFEGCGSLYTVRIPSSVTSIGSDAFYACYSLAEVINQSSLEISLMSTSYGYVGYYAIQVISDPSLTKLRVAYGGYVIYDNGYESILVRYIGKDNYSMYSEGYVGGPYCPVIPEGVTAIRASAFDSVHTMTSVVIPSTVTAIDSGAFTFCYALTEVVNLSSLDIQAGSSSYGGVAKSAKQVISSWSESKISWDGDDGYIIYQDGSDVILIGCADVDRNLYVPSNVTVIGKYALYFCQSLTSVSIPSSVRSIEEYAFARCYSLRSVIFNSGLVSVGDYAFYDCPNLFSINLPNTVISIGQSAFAGGTSLKSISVPDSICSVGSSAFHFDSLFQYNRSGAGKYIGNPDQPYVILVSVIDAAITEFEIESGCRIICSNAFSNVPKLASIAIPTSIRDIGYSAFSGCSSLLTGQSYGGAIYLGNGSNPCLVLYKVESANIESCSVAPNCRFIYDRVFQNCVNLVEVILPDTLQSIGYRAFESCYRLNSITLPSSLTYLGTSAFDGCRCLCEITNLSSLGEADFERSNANDHVKQIINDPSQSQVQVRSDGSVTYYDQTLDYLYFIGYRGSADTVVVPDGVKGILDYALYNRKTIVGVTLPSSLVDLGTLAFYYTGITSMVIPDSVTSISDGAFYYCRSLEAVVLPESLVSIGDSAFYGCVALSSVTLLGNQLKTIGPRAFSSCAFTSIAIPSSVTSIGEYAFASCSSLTTAYIPSSVTLMEKYIFNSCSSLQSLTIPDLASYVGSYRGGYLGYFFGASSYSQNASKVPASLKTVTILDGAKSIAYRAFAGCSNLEVIRLPQTVTTIGEEAFLSCASLQYNEYENALYLGSEDDPYLHLIKASNETITSCEISSNCRTIYESAFEGCTKLSSIAIPDSVVTIHRRAFYYVLSLTSVTFGNGLKTIGNDAFNNCYHIASVVLPASLETIGADAFNGCSAITNLTIGNAVTSIGARAFRDCYNVTNEIFLSSSIISIGADAFKDCSTPGFLCQSTSKPAGWNESWNSSSRPVTWGYSA